MLESNNRYCKGADRRVLPLESIPQTCPIRFRDDVLDSAEMQKRVSVEDMLSHANAAAVLLDDEGPEKIDNDRVMQLATTRDQSRES